MMSPGAEREHVKSLHEIARELKRIADALERSNKIKALKFTTKINENIKEDEDNE